MDRADSDIFKLFNVITAVIIAPSGRGQCVGATRVLGGPMCSVAPTVAPFQFV